MGLMVIHVLKVVGVCDASLGHLSLCQGDGAETGSL